MVLNYSKVFAADSCLNTPPAFNLYVLGVVLEHLSRQGDLRYWDGLCRRKSAEVYRHCDESDGFFAAPVKQQFRSRVTVRFEITAHQSRAQTEALDRHKADGCSKRELTDSGVRAPQQQTDEEQLLLDAKQQDAALTKLFLQQAEQRGMLCLVEPHPQALNPKS